MSEKKVVDDYYSSIPEAVESTESHDGDKKHKIKPKKKIIVKKVIVEEKDIPVQTPKV